jgi:acyl carrier protein
MGNVEDNIASYIAEKIIFKKTGYPYPYDASFLDNGVIDSVNVLELVTYVEDTYHIKVEDEEINPENFDSIMSMVQFLETKLNSK